MKEVDLIQEILNTDGSVHKAIAFNVGADGHALTSVVKRLNTPLYISPL